MSCKPRQLNKFLSLAYVSFGGVLSFGALGVYRGDETIYSRMIMPFVSRYIDPEFAHEACIFLTKLKLIRCQDKLTQEQADRLKVDAFNMKFINPVGLAAGFDKSSNAIEGLPHYGLGFAEIGTVTPKPQSGNPRKRIFRIAEDGALINRCGFNNEGIDYVKEKLTKDNLTLKPMIVGLNLGKNKDTKHISNDYLIGLEKSKDLEVVDYLVINISSPNTPGLRDLQDKKKLELLLDDVLSKMNELNIDKPLLIKVAPDLTKEQIKDISDVIMHKRHGKAKVSGIILTNTTVTRPKPMNDLRAEEKDNEGYKRMYSESGGLSGKPLRDLSTDIISEFYESTKGGLPIVGVGGISSGQDAYDKIKSGATLVQLYTSLTYEGPPVINKIKRELVELLERDKLDSISEAIGIKHRSVKK